MESLRSVTTDGEKGTICVQTADMAYEIYLDCQMLDIE